MYLLYWVVFWLIFFLMTFFSFFYLASSVFVFFHNRKRTNTEFAVFIQQLLKYFFNSLLGSSIVFCYECLLWSFLVWIFYMNGDETSFLYSEKFLPAGLGICNSVVCLLSWFLDVPLFCFGTCSVIYSYFMRSLRYWKFLHHQSIRLHGIFLISTLNICQ